MDHQSLRKIVLGALAAAVAGVTLGNSVTAEAGFFIPVVRPPIANPIGPISFARENGPSFVEYTRGIPVIPRPIWVIR